jgi:chemotaxis protein CheD
MSNWTEPGIDDQQGSAEAVKAASELNQMYLHPGNLCASREPVNLSFIVGSCVGICIFNPRLSIGGAAHYLLPLQGDEGAPSPRYGDVAIKQLLDGMMQAGSTRKDLRAHIYGGACVVQAFQDSKHASIGDKNVRVALDMLSQEKIAVVHQETGGQKGRKISMRTDTGEIICSLIGS